MEQRFLFLRNAVADFYQRRHGEPEPVWRGGVLDWPLPGTLPAAFALQAARPGRGQPVAALSDVAAAPGDRGVLGSAGPRGWRIQTDQDSDPHHHRAL